MSKILEALKGRIHNNRFVSLNFKLTVMILVAAGVTLLVFFACSLLQSVVTNHVFQSKFMKERFVDRKYDELKSYIRDNDVKSTDKKKLHRWMEDKRYTELIVYSEKGQVFSGGLVVDPNGTVSSDSDTGSEAANSGTKQPKIESKPKIDTKNFKRDTYNRIIRFRDRSCFVYINVYYEQAWMRISTLLAALLAVFTFFFVILRYNKAVLFRASELSADVKRIANGDMGEPIEVGPHDELGELAESVNRMQDSLKAWMAAEQTAKDANAQLITSMSHDIRTPLTSLIGYLDIIESGRYDTLEDLSHYIHSCRDKAVQLKGLSDKLFNYFLVFGSQEDHRAEEMETVDAGILFQQLLAEHISEIMDYGYETDFHYEIPEQVMIRTDIQGIQRVFDNLFSNIMKYASKDFVIEVKADLIADRIKLILQNHITEDAKKVESTKIGVKTCRKIIEDTGGSFHAMEEEKIYTTEILIPILPEAEAQVAITEIQEEEEAAKEEKAQEAAEQSAAGAEDAAGPDRADEETKNSPDSAPAETTDESPESGSTGA